MMPVMGAAAGCVSSCPCSSSSSVAAAAAASPMLTISKLPLCSTFLPLQAQQQPSCCGYEWRWRKRRRRRRRDWGAGGVCVRAAEPNVVESQTVVPSSAKDAINLGLSLFSKGRVRDALAQFDSALEMRPNAEEAQAALYNKACCHARREEGVEASKALRLALKQYDLKFSTILNDPDMASFRAMTEFKQLQDEARKGGEEVGESFRRDLKLISEVQAPFRGVRKFFYVSFAAAAGISTLFTLPRFVSAIQGGEGAPGLLETSQNLAINISGAAILVALYIWDSRKEEEQIARITRDETLSRLPLRLATNRVVELVQLRETTRPVIVAGSKEVVAKALRQADKYREELLKRGVLLVPLVWTGTNEAPFKKKGFGGSQKPATTPIPIGDEFETRAQEVASKGVVQSERRFKAEPVSPLEWQSWVQEQQASEKVTPGEDVYIVLRLDGRVRKSGRGTPDWQELINELPPLDTFISKLEK